jgi:signal transduction histidine kinase
MIYHAIFPSQSESSWFVNLLMAMIITAGMFGWGMYIGSRRELLWTLRQRAERAEAERDLRAGKARSDERARIAREMHDVLAHRISQVSMHAGALAFRDDLDADALRAGIGDVQAMANEALTDLRGVLGVLRDPDGVAVANRPQPTYDDLVELVEIARGAGAKVVLTDQLSADDVPISLGRTLYRVVQEGITNAQKHAAGATLDVQISGDVDRGVEVVLRNPFRPGPPAAPGAGLGLVGLAERVELAGGHLVHGREGSVFVVRASLPWSE